VVTCKEKGWATVLTTSISKQPPWPMKCDSRATNYKVGTTEVPKKSKVIFMHIFISSVGDTSFQSVKYKLQNTGDCTCYCQAEWDI